MARRPASTRSATTGAHRAVVARARGRARCHRRRHIPGDVRSGQPEAADRRGREAADRPRPDPPGSAFAWGCRCGRPLLSRASPSPIPPGFSRPQMATLDRLDLRALADPAAEPPDRDRPAGAGQAGHPAGDGRKGTAQLAVRAGSRRSDPAARTGRLRRNRQEHATRISVAAVRIEDGTVTLRDARRTRHRGRHQDPGCQRRVTGCKPAHLRGCELQRHALHGGRRIRSADPAAGSGPPVHPGRCS